MRKLTKMKATYVSVWDDGIKIETDCDFNPQTNEVSNIKQADVLGLDILDEEYVLFQDKKITEFEII